MERKLLSLPSFFVLLLVAGIAFLAAPVGDVQAQTAPTATVERVTMTPSGDSAGANALVAGGAKNLFIVKFQTPVNVDSATATTKFDAADLKVTFTDSSAAAQSTGGEIPTARITVTPIATTAAAPLPAAPAANRWFAVSVTVPANGTGTITLVVRGSTQTPAGAFQSADNGLWATTADTPATGTAHIVHYNTYDGAAPTAAFAAALGLTAATSGTNAFTAIGGSGAADIFQIEITIADNKGIATSGEGAFVVASDVKLTTTLANPPATAPATDLSKIHSSWMKGTDTATSVTRVVVIDPADDAATVKIEVMKDSVTDTGDPANKIAKTEATVTINAPPTVMISITSGGSAVPDPIPTSFTSAIEVKIQTSAVPVGFGGTTAANLQESDITVTNGTLQAGSLVRSRTAAPTATAAATYTAMVTLPDAADRKSPFTIKVAAGSFQAGGLNNTAATESRIVTIPTTTPTPPTTPTEEGTDLPNNRRGFSFTLAMPTPAATGDGSDRFVVLAKSADAAMNGISGPVIDIKDDAWEDLRDFLAYDGGSIDLKGPGGTTAKDLVISEVMWGSDNGLSDPTMSQWIELYNTKTTRGTAATTSNIAGTWTIEFHAGAASTAAVSDRFSNRKLGQAHWNIPDTSGGAYGQSGRTKLTPGTAGSLRDLVSMRRKIDYAKVEKNDHKAAGAADDTANRTEQLKGIPDGALAGSWEASTSRRNLSGTRKGTPGTKPLAIIAQTVVNRNGIVFNEIGNRDGSTNDWIELYNRGSAEVKINKYELSKVGDDGKDVKLFQFASDQDVIIPAKGYLLVLNSDPSGTNIAEGADVNDSDGGEKGNSGGSSVRYYQNSGLNIPNDKFMLVLRTEPKLGSHEKIADIAGNQFVSNTASATEVWPLRATRKPLDANALNDLKKDDSKSWVRDFGKALFHPDEWKTSDVKGPGYKRSADSLNSGTPGYPNNAVQNEVKSDGLTHATPVVISEIMYGSGNRRVPQWIELYNPSTTQTVNLEKWTLEIQNTKSPNEDLRTETNSTLTLKKLLVHPNQTVLIVSTHGSTSKTEHFPSSRVYNLWNNHKEDLDMSSRRDAVLSSIGFYLELSDPRKRVVDEIGNLDGNKRTNDDPTWSLPGGNLEDGGRASMIRREGSFNDGTVEDAWISAAIVDGLQKVGINDLYFGSPDDVGTPGYRAGGPLPVQLSSFYSKRNDAGAVVITWSTESELDNAGFNILRSLSRAGEFTRINAQLIPGAGTTGEKNTYTWTDTSARPNVVYYYQIEDVSLDGEHRTLRTTRLRGYVGAAGKATTIWGELKSRD